MYAFQAGARVGHGGEVGLKVDTAVEPPGPRVALLLGNQLACSQVQARQSRPDRRSLPACGHARRVRQQVEAMHENEWLAVHPHITGVQQCGQQRGDVRFVVLIRVMLAQ